jgi:hypothetical protein
MDILARKPQTRQRHFERWMDTLALCFAGEPKKGFLCSLKELRAFSFRPAAKLPVQQ